MKRYELKKEQWDRIKQMLPPEETGKRERPHKDNRTMLNGMLWIVRSGAQWRELPEATALGSQCMPDLPNGGMTAHWKECFTRFLGMKTWKI